MKFTIIRKMEKIKYVIGIVSLIALLLFSGCSNNVREIHNPAYFEDTNNSVTNYEECNRLLKKACDENWRCDNYRITKLECDEGLCFCD